MGGDGPGILGGQGGGVSIRAPHGGRPSCPTRLPAPARFQSAPPHGGRLALYDRNSRPGWFRFNPRPRMGGDRSRRRKDRHCDQRVSIRAPAWGATVLRSAPLVLRGLSVFQSAPPHGGRQPAGRDAATPDRYPFQSAPPHGGRHAIFKHHARSVLKAFQSAPPHGGRRNGRPEVVSKRAVSIRAPHGGRRPVICFSTFLWLFQSAPPHGGRLLTFGLPGPHDVVRCFNPRPRMGGDRERSELSLPSSYL